MGFIMINVSIIHRHQPYFFTQEKLPRLILILIVLSFVFNYFFEPYVVYEPEQKMGYHWICLIHTIFPALIFFAYFSAWNYLGEAEKPWTIAKYLLHFSIVFMLVGIENFLIRDIIYDNPHNWSIGYLIEEIRNALFSGYLLVALITPTLYFLSQKEPRPKEQLSHASTLSSTPSLQGKDFLIGTNHLPSSSPTAPYPLHHDFEISITTQVKTDDFHLPLDQFLFAMSDGNYVAFYIQTACGWEKWLKRMTMKVLEQQLAEVEWLVKTHRAYLVNTQKIVQVKGNARGYQLTLDGYSEKVPVSRGMVAEFDELMRKDMLVNVCQ